jgi:hypothetical protein
MLFPEIQTTMKILFHKIPFLPIHYFNIDSVNLAESIEN